MLRQQRLMSMQHAQYVLLFLVLAVNSNWFQISWSYSSCLFLWALGSAYSVWPVAQQLSQLRQTKSQKMKWSTIFENDKCCKWQKAG